MQNIDCDSILNNQDSDFNQLNTVTSHVRELLDSYTDDINPGTESTFELPPHLLIPLENLDEQLTTLFTKTKDELNESQLKYLLGCKRAIALIYCHLQDFIKSIATGEEREPFEGQQRKDKNIAYTFYLLASYEVRTPYNILKCYAKAQELNENSIKWQEFVQQIFTSPFLPENEERVKEISFWTDELGKFISDLPQKMREYGYDDIA